jgi:hypothetical protein
VVRVGFAGPFSEQFINDRVRLRGVVQLQFALLVKFHLTGKVSNDLPPG